MESLRDIRLFVAAYEQGSFTAAALRENATQSGVSQHMRKLEDRFGVKLFLRGAVSITPTPAGDSYYRHCVDLLRRYETAQRAVRGFGGGLDGEIVIGLMPSMTRSALAPALARFVEEQPNVVVRIVEAYSATLTEGVQSNALDFAIVPAFAGAVGLRHRLFLRTPEVLVTRGQMGLAHLSPICLRDRGPLKIVVPGRGNTRRLTVETYLAANGVGIDRLIELDAMLGTLDYIATSDWVAILPGIMMANDAMDRRLCVNPLTDPPLGLDLVLIEPSRRAMSPAAEAFLGVLSEETERMNRRWGDEWAT